MARFEAEMVPVIEVFPTVEAIPRDELLELKKAVDFLLDNVTTVHGGKRVTMRELLGLMEIKG